MDDWCRGQSLPSTSCRLRVDDSETVCTYTTPKTNGWNPKSWRFAEHLLFILVWFFRWTSRQWLKVKLALQIIRDANMMQILWSILLGSGTTLKPQGIVPKVKTKLIGHRKIWRSTGFPPCNPGPKLQAIWSATSMWWQMLPRLVIFLESVFYSIYWGLIYILMATHPALIFHEYSMNMMFF